MQALFYVLVLFRLLARGFSNRDLREHLALLLGINPSQMTQGRMTYHLRRLRLHGLIQRIAGTHRYRVTDFGLRTALFFTRTYARVLRPGLAQVMPATPSQNAPLHAHFHRLERAMDQWVAEAKLVA